MALSEPDVIIEKAQKGLQEWEKQQVLVEEMRIRSDHWQDEHEKRRRLLSFQHEVGGVSNDEYMTRLRQLQREVPPDVKVFDTPKPPSPEQIRRGLNIVEQFSQHLAPVFRAANGVKALQVVDEIGVSLAEETGLQVIISPSNSPGYRFSAKVIFNLPIAEYSFDSETNNATVFVSSLYYGRRLPPPPVPVSRAPAP